MNVLVQFDSVAAISNIEAVDHRLLASPYTTRSSEHNCTGFHRTQLRSLEHHDALFSAVGLILPAKLDPFSIEDDQAVVGDGYAMGVAAEIAQHMLGTAEGRLGIDDPALLLQSFHGCGEQVTVLESECETAAVEQSLL